MEQPSTSTGTEPSTGLKDCRYINFRHPGYPDDCNILLRLPALDEPSEGSKHGVHHETARIACALLALNQWDGHLSTSRIGDPLDESPDDLLVLSDYYFFTPGAASAPADESRSKFPVVASFLCWEFPKDNLPPYWIAAMPNELLSESVRHSLLAEHIFRVPQRCALTGVSNDRYPVHTLFWINRDGERRDSRPREGDQWFWENGLLEQNCLALCEDIWRYHRPGTFCFVPKMFSTGSPTFVLHALTSHSSSPQAYHNLPLKTLGTVGLDMFFAYFAYCIIQCMRQTFLAAGVERILKRDSRIQPTMGSFCVSLAKHSTEIAWFEDDSEVKQYERLFFALPQDCALDTFSTLFHDISAQLPGNQSLADGAQQWDIILPQLKLQNAARFSQTRSTIWQLVLNMFLKPSATKSWERLLELEAEQGCRVEESKTLATAPSNAIIEPDIKSSIDCGQARPTPGTSNDQSVGGESATNSLEPHLISHSATGTFTVDDALNRSYTAVAEKFVRHMAHHFTPSNANAAAAWQESIDQSEFIKSVRRNDEPATRQNAAQTYLEDLLWPRAEKGLETFLQPSEDRDASSPLVYEPLASSQSIRILEMQPGKGNEDIVCELKEISIGDDQEVDFCALSYVWGDPKICSPITVNGTQFHATRNLKSAMKHIRLPPFIKEPQRIWVDAVCINQGDLDERQQQVQMMRDIYCRAKKVFVWLGEAGDEGDTIVSLCSRLESHYAKIMNHKTMSLAYTRAWTQRLGRSTTAFETLQTWMSQGFNAADYKDSEDFLEVDDQSRDQCEDDVPKGVRPTDEEWLALSRLLTRPWFSRAWCLQEATLPKSVLFFVGQRSLEWEKLQFAIYSCDQFFGAGSLPDTYMPFLSLQALRDEIHKNTRNRDIQSLLVRFRGCQATDPRDKVYALFGITTTDLQAVGLSPNYRRSIQASYTAVTLAVLRSSRNLSVLCESLRTDLRMKDLPSWVPDWSDCGPHPTSMITWPTPNLMYPKKPNHGFFAAKGSVAPEIVIKDETILCLKGHSFDRVARIGDKLTDKCSRVINESTSNMHRYSYDMVRMVEENIRKAVAVRGFLNEMIAWHDLAALTTEGDKAYPAHPSQSIREAFIKTISMDHPLDGAEAASNVIKEWCRIVETADVKDFLRGDDEPARIEEEAQVMRIMQTTTSLQSVIRSMSMNAAPSYYRRFAITERGMFAMVPEQTQVGDHLFLLQGAPVPFAMRMHETTSGRWDMIGSAYVHGVMNGEMYDAARCVEIEIA